jgi:hypothetical protein
MLRALVRRLLAGALAALLLVGCISSNQDGNQGPAPSTGAATTRPPARATGQLTPEGLREAVTTDAIRRHLDALQAAADGNGGNRAAGTEGYEA